MQNKKKIDINLIKGYIKFTDKHNYIKSKHSYEKNEKKLVLKELKKGYENIIDLCCGTGRLIPHKKVIAIDQSVESLKKINNETICGLAQFIPIKDNWADCIVFSQAFQYIPIEEHDKVLSEIHRCLRTEGSLIISTFCHDSIFLKLINKINKKKWVQNGFEIGVNGFKLKYHRFTKEEIFKKLEENGFNKIQIQTCKNFPFDLLSTKLDYFISIIGLTIFGSHIVVHAKKK